MSSSRIEGSKRTHLHGASGSAIVHAEAVVVSGIDSTTAYVCLSIYLSIYIYLSGVQQTATGHAIG